MSDYEELRDKLESVIADALRGRAISDYPTAEVLARLGLRDAWPLILEVLKDKDRELTRAAQEYIEMEARVAVWLKRASRFKEQLQQANRLLSAPKTPPSSDSGTQSQPAASHFTVEQEGRKRLPSLHLSDDLEA